MFKVDIKKDGRWITSFYSKEKTPSKAEADIMKQTKKLNLPNGCTFIAREI